MKEEIIRKREKILWYDNPSKDWDLWCIIYWVMFGGKVTITRVVYVKKEQESIISNKQKNDLD